MFSQILVLVSLLAVSNACNSTNIMQWSCYIVGSEKTMSEIAHKHNMITKKLCDYNSWELRGSCDAAPTGVSLRIPNNTCMEGQAGNYKCYTVKSGDTLKSIVQTLSPIRDEIIFQQYNEDLLWGQSEVEENMLLRLPIKTCFEKHNISSGASTQDCHTVKANEDIWWIASQYKTTADNLVSLNSDILGGSTAVIVDMQLIVPYNTPVQPSPCADNEDFGCYTVEESETLWNISKKLGHDEYILGGMNGIEVTNHTVIDIGEILTYHKYSCNDKIGNFVCLTYTDQYNSGPIPVTNLPSFVDQAPFKSMAAYSPSGPGREYFDRFMELNAEKISCKNLTDTGQCYAYTNMTFKFPVVHCIPNNEFTCLLNMEKDNYGLKTVQLYQLGSFFFYETFNMYVMGGRYTLQPYSEVELMQPYAGGSGNVINKPGEQIAYKIQTQDTLFTIAQRFGLDWQALCQLNEISDCNKIGYYSSLKIPLYSKLNNQEEFLG